MAEDKVTSVSEYRNKIGEAKIVEVPSGQKFKVKKLTVIDYIENGLSDIPNEFFTFLSELSKGKLENLSSKKTEENYKLFEKFLEVTISHGVIEPPMVIKYDKDKKDTHLLYSELTQEDQKYLVDVIAGKISG